MEESREYLEAKKTKLGLGHYRRHVLLCTGPKCCSAEEGERAYEELKNQISHRGLMDGENACYRTKVNCLRVCGQGPIGVVYPEGTWYHGLSADRIPELVERHLINGQPVVDWVFAENPLAQETK